MSAWRSLILTCLFMLALTGVAHADPLRILVSVGAKNGLGDDRPLTHTAADAAAVRDVMTALGGVRPDNVVYVAEADRTAILAALSKANAMARTHPPGEVTLFFYFSGHGDHDAIHVSGELLATEELDRLLSGVAAGLRVAVIDACRTSRDKGMSSKPAFSVSLGESAPASGSVWLFAAADGEAAQESDEIGGALFTHFWLGGLRGAADNDGDGRITLDESFSYAHAQTLLRSARAGGVLQRPEARLDLTARSPLILTELPKHRVELELPREADVLYLVYAAQSKSVIAEVYGAADHAVRVALPAGRYIVQRRSGTRGAAVNVSLQSGRRVLAADEFREFASEALAQKGSMVVRPFSVGFSTAVLTGVKLNVGGEAAIHAGWRSSKWGLDVAGLGGIGTRRTDANDVLERSVGVELSADGFLPVSGWLEVRVGGDLRGQWIAQRVTRRDADRLALGRFTASQTFTGGGAGGGIHMGLRIALGTRLFADVSGRALGLAMKSDSGIEARVYGGAAFGLGMAF